MINRKNALVICFMLPMLSAYKPLGVHKINIRTVVIDAGHGGHDTGCSYGGANEKDVTLEVALKVGAQLKEMEPGMKVIYTRNSDVFIELWERAGIANRNNADLFVSIHCNANKKTEPFGTETFAMGLHKSDANLEVAKRENEVILLEKDYQEKYEGFDPNSPEAHIYFSFMQNAFLQQRLKRASMVQDNFKKINRSSRGVKQAGLMVLWRSKMPSVLIETGFLSNKAERAYLTSEEGQQQMARAVALSVMEYKSKLEGVK
ncbi:MAG: N-acetylmuramoyl-L-alanine amidase [Bacteroidota bacterium]